VQCLRPKRERRRQWGGIFSSYNLLGNADGYDGGFGREVVVEIVFFIIFRNTLRATFCDSPLQHIREFEDNAGDGDYDINQMSLLVAFKVNAAHGRFIWWNRSCREMLLHHGFVCCFLPVRLLYFGVLDFRSTCSA
jgi:hypothetical protein